LIHIKATLSASHISQVKLSKIAEAYMSETQTHTEKAFPFSFDTSEFAALGKKRMEAFVNAQTELLDEIQEANRHWMDRFQSEANLASEYASNLSGARTIPDAMAVSRDWATRYFQRLAEDGKHLRMTPANSWKRARGCSQTGRRPRRKRSF
jgi:CRISPR/Cas system-associated endonuclease Cas1